MEYLFDILQLLVITFVLTDLGAFMSELIPTPTKKIIAVPTLILKYWMSCPKCAAFWITIILTGDLFTAALVALIINYAKELEYKIKNKTEL
jgi:hypothetical protein